MAIYNQKQREANATIGKDRFPMGDRAHAQNALARLNQAKGLSPAQKAKVRARAHRILGKGHYSDGAIKAAQSLKK